MSLKEPFSSYFSEDDYFLEKNTEAFHLLIGSPSPPLPPLRLLLSGLGVAHPPAEQH